MSDYDSSNFKRARVITDKYSLGREVEVFYEPDNPSNAVLEPGIRFIPAIVFMTGAVFFIAAILGFLGIIGGKGGYSF